MMRRARHWRAKRRVRHALAVALVAIASITAPVAADDAPTRDAPIRVVLDPGHGGPDPGAEHGGISEAELVLLFAEELRDALVQDGRFAVTLTREDDVFVSLEERISTAHDARAEVFLSLHADAVDEGRARGATIYTLSKGAEGKAGRTLLDRHARDDLLAGIDLAGHDDALAGVLMSMARAELAPRTRRLADALEARIRGADIRMHRHPQQGAGFSVLKLPDVPSILLELGFLSSDTDRALLVLPVWRARMIEAIRLALLDWHAGEGARAANTPVMPDEIPGARGP